ncbi:dynactin 3, p24 subunit [Anticarsia gemmatalis]|uniref:dynactin 3, p24 subunit n=1 Tax=Anticarsia gemmatalis TaxID=129554 RepID=UPI003F77027A
MDPIAVLQNRIEQLEAKLGLAANTPIDGQQGDSATQNLLNTAQAISNATAGNEKLSEAMQIASELNNYTDPNFVENMQQNQMHMHEVAAAEPVIKHHCHCMQRCKQAAAVLESEPIQHVAQMQEVVNNMQAAAAEVKAEADEVSAGVQQLAETCGAAASDASEQLANVAQKVEQVEQKMFPRRRNGLD